MLVAGAAGFIGTHLCDRLLNDGHHVVGLDNLCTGNKKNIDYLTRRSSRFAFIHSDVENAAWLQAPQVNIPWKFDAVFHLASPASPPFFLKHPLHTIHANTNGTEVLLNFAAAHGARFLFASTSEIYGDPTVHPQVETYTGNVNPIGPRSVYDEAKRLGETLTMTYHRTKGVDTRIVRIFNTYGPRMQMHDGRVVPNFISQALKHEPLTIYGTGTQTRSLCFVDDLVNGLIAVMQQDDPTPFNIGNPHEITMLELAQQVLALLPLSKSVIVHKDLPIDDPTRRQPDITKIQQLDWVPRVALQDGLELTIAYMRNQLPPVPSLDLRELISRSQSGGVQVTPNGSSTIILN